MRKLIGLLCALLVAVPTASAVASPSISLAPKGSAADAVLFAGGGTLLSNGYFFPGTAVSNNGEYLGPPLEVTQGSNVQFINLDHFAASGGGHKVASFKLVKRGGRRVPLFASKLVDGPGQDLMITSHVKPGVYAFFCPIHPGMLGQLEVK
jgi:plastocyanin